MIGQSLADLWYGFGVALTPHNLMWSFFGVLIGNLIGVLPGWVRCPRSRCCCR
jgi:TctA family transporter